MTLYAARGGNVASDLYTVDPSDASETSVGSTGYALTGLAFDPTDGTLYGATSNQSPGTPRAIVTINPSNGTTVLVGSTGLANGNPLADIAFDSDGVLYGYSAGTRRLYTVNKSTGVATQVSTTAITSGFGMAMDFDAGDCLFVLPYGDDLTPPSQIHIVEQSNGAHITYSTISGSPPYGTGAAFNAGTFAPGRIFYAYDNDFGAGTHLVTVDICTGEVVDIGVATTGMDALASDERATSAWAYRILATDIINPDCPTASVVSGRVREDWQDWWDFGSNGYNLPNKTLKFTWAGEAGMYKMTVFGQLAAAGSGSVFVEALINGRPFRALRGNAFSGTTPGSWSAYFGLDAATLDVYDPASDYAQQPWLPLTTGDRVEIQVMSQADLTGFSGFNAFETMVVRFEWDCAAPASTYCTGAVVFDDAPLGDDWGDVDSWGGQRLIPDEIYAWLGVGPDDPHTIGVDFPWGINYTDYDMVALEDGTVYVFLHDARTTSPPTTTPTSEYHYAVIKKYDPGGGTWSQIATVNIRDPTLHYPVDSMNCEYDGTHVYFAWWELDTYTPGAPAKYLWKWHMLKLDPSDDSYVELGTGQNASTVVNQSTNYDMIGVVGTTLGISIAFSGGKVYAANIEIPDNAWAAFDQYRRRGYVWVWDGASWTNTSFPDPSVTEAPSGTSAFNNFEIIGENQFWDVLINLIAANEDGLKADGVTAVYSYRYFKNSDAFDHYPLVKIEYTDGSGWAGELLTDLVVVEAGRSTETVNWRIVGLDMTPLWSDKLGKLVLALDMSGPWDVLQFGASDWEVIESVAPGSSASPWRQSRNSADIGPDGDVWRGMMGDEADVNNFEPQVTKHSPGFTFGFANAEKKSIGQIVAWTDPQGNVWSGSYVNMFATANYRIRWVGNSCYVMGNFHIEPQFVNGDLFADSPLFPSNWPDGDGFFVVKGTYAPCGGSIPLFRPRVFSVSTP